MIKYTISKSNEMWYMNNEDGNPVHSAESLRKLLAAAYKFEAMYENREVISFERLYRAREIAGLV